MLRTAGVAFEVVPGISSAIAAPAYAGIPLTHRDYSSAVTIATGHENPAKAESAMDWSKLADPNRTLVFLMAVGNLAEIAGQLQRHGLDADTPVAVIENGTRPGQRTAIGTLQTIASEVKRESIGAPAVVVVGNVVKLRERVAWFDATPLFGKRVLITRAARQAAEFAGALLERGAEPIVAPTIAIEPPDDPVALSELLELLRAGGWVAFTSENAVDALFERLAPSGKDARVFGACRIAAIGPATADALRRRELLTDLMPAEYVGEALARALLERTQPGESITILCAQGARDVLGDALAQAGRHPRRSHLYKTALVRNGSLADDVARADVVTFASGSAVRGYAHAFGGGAAAVSATRGKLVACIGPVTAGTAREVGLNVDVVATTFTAQGLIDALEEHLAQRC
jgi:uroporphyrinogen III methyltransferase / synthase